MTKLKTSVRTSSRSVPYGETEDVCRVTVRGISGTITPSILDADGATIDSEGNISLSAPLGGVTKTVLAGGANANGTGAWEPIVLIEQAEPAGDIAPANLPDFYYGIHPTTSREWDSGLNMFGDLGMVGAWRYLNSSNALTASVVIMDPETAAPTGQIETGDGLGSVALVWSIYGGAVVGIGCGGTYTFTPQWDTTGWTVTTWSSNVTITHLGGGSFRFTVTDGSMPSISIKFTPPTTNTAIPGSLIYKAYRAGDDETKITSATARSLYGAATKPFNRIRTMKLTQAENRLVELSVWPYVRHSMRAFSPMRQADIAVELGHHVHYAMPALYTNAHYELHARGFAQRLKEHTAWCSSGLAFFFELGNEIWNQEAAYMEVISIQTMCAIEAGFFSDMGIDPGTVENDVYAKTFKASWSATTTSRALAFGDRVLHSLPNSAYDQIVECIAAGGAPIGSTIPTGAVNTTNGAGTLKVIAQSVPNIVPRRNKWRAWMTGNYAEWFNDELGADRGFAYYGTFQNETSASVITSALLAGGTGTEYARKIHQWGGGHYTTFSWGSVPNPPLTGFGAYVGVDLDQSAELFIDEMETRLAAVVTSYQTLITAVRTALDSAGIPSDRCEYVSYEGGPHIGTLTFSSGGATQRNAWAVWLGQLYDRADWGAFCKKQLKDIAASTSLVKGLTEFNMVEHLVTTGSDISLRNFAIEQVMGEETPRYLGILDAIAELEA